MNDNPSSENLRHSTAMRVLIFAFIFLICTLLGSLVTLFMVSGGDVLLKWAQGISSLLMFVVPPVVYYLVTRKESQMWQLGFRRVAHPAWLLVLIGVAVMFVSLPITNQLTTWNEGMKLGPAFEALETWIRNLEDSAEGLTERMLNVNTFSGLLLNLLVIALIPALGEEMTFRGVVQQSLTRRMKSPHVAILLSAAIFSFIHFQFYGFLPRMFLGILLGYMFYITRSLWTSVLMHFLNNGTLVVLYYLNNRGITHVDVEHFGESASLWWVALSLVVTTALVVWGWRKAER